MYVVDVVDCVVVYCWVEEVVVVYGKVNLIFNNVGVVLFSMIEGMEDDELVWIMNINFWGVVYGIKVFLLLFKVIGNGYIINMLSIFGIFVQLGMGVYNVSKYVVCGYIEVLCQELDLMNCGVLVMCVYLGGIKINIVKLSCVLLSMNGFLVCDEQQGKVEFEKFFIILVDKVVQVILDGVCKNKCCVLIGFDVYVVDVMVCLLLVVYQVLVVCEVCCMCKKVLCDDMVLVIVCVKQEVVDEYGYYWRIVCQFFVCEFV